MNAILKLALAAGGMALSAQASASVVFYEYENFSGRSFTSESQIDNMTKSGFNDRASSIVVLNDRWEACEHTKFGGQCIVLRPGRYPSLAAMGMNNKISSVRIVQRNARVEEDRYAPAAAPVYDNRRRNNERLYEANVTSVRAVVGPAEQRCWIEREQVTTQSRGDANVPGAIVGALLGGVLGHQVGGGRGQDVATAGGAVAGAMIGSNVGRDGSGQQTHSQDVQRCANVPSQSRPEFWDVTYDFKGQEHRIQMTSPPGPTVTVNGKGEPRA